MSLPVFLLGTVSIWTVWAIIKLGLQLPPNIWTFGVILVLLIYYLCDHQKVREAAAQVRRSRVRFLGAAMIVGLFSILFARFRFVPWKLGVLLVWLSCMSKSFDYEKAKFSIDTAGAWIKVLLWIVVTKFTSEAKWMSFKGRWAFCCPYGRKLLVRETNHYYKLQKNPEELEIIPENYKFDFEIGSCSLHCEYTAPFEGRGNAGRDYSSARAVVSSPMESDPSLMSSVHERENAHTASGSSGSLSQERECSSTSKTERGEIVEDRPGDRYTLVPSRFNKLKASLKYKGTILESYTFHNIASDAVAAWKRALEVLDREGNLIFSHLNREIGASRPRAHARCYEFGELTDFILNQSFKLHEVDLRANYLCTISGCWILQLQVWLQVAVTLGIHYYQLTGPPQHLSTTIMLLIFYGFVYLFFSLVDNACSEGHILRRLVYFVIRKIAPGEVAGWYKYFQAHKPCLTFCNESYCYPYLSRGQKQICLLEDGPGGGPIRYPSGINCDSPRPLQPKQPLQEGMTYFDLKNVKLVLTIKFYGEEQRRDKVQVQVAIFRVYDLDWSLRFFQNVEKSNAAGLISLMSWQDEHNCPGVCKDWPQSDVMHAYRYEEIFQKVLKEGTMPVIAEVGVPIDITVK